MVDSKYSDNAKEIYKNLYRSPDEDTIEQVHIRVANAIGINDTQKKAFLEALNNKAFRPNTPCLINAGRTKGNNPFDRNLVACFLTHLEDSMDSIIELWNCVSKIYAGAGGAGIPITNLRELDAPVSTGGHACLTKDTKILTNSNKLLTINEISYNFNRKLAYENIVKCIDSNNKVVSNQIKAIYHNGYRAVFEVITKNDYRIKATLNHRFLSAKNEYIELNQFAIGDKISILNTTSKYPIVDYDEIIAINHIGRNDVYDIEMEEPYHNFIANGFISHNSGPLKYLQVVQSISETVKSGGRCLAPYQPILTKNGMKTIKELTDLDNEFSILSYNLLKKKITFKSAIAYKSGFKKIYSLKTDKGEFHLSEDHPVLTSNHQYVQVKDLSEGVLLMGCSPTKFHIVKTIDYIDEMDVYDIEVFCRSPNDLSIVDNHNFTIMSINKKDEYGLLVHNSRRAANLISAKYNHPDIIDIIEAKQKQNLSAMNISIMVDDEFMNLVINNRDESIDLLSPNNKTPVKKIKVQQLWDTIVHYAHKRGDPGLLFYNKLNENNPFPSFGAIEATNP